MSTIIMFIIELIIIIILEYKYGTISVSIGIHGIKMGLEPKG